MFEKGLEEENPQIEGNPKKKWKGNGKKMSINSKRGKTVFN